jgi:hypothetical protein
MEWEGPPAESAAVTVTDWMPVGVPGLGAAAWRAGDELHAVRVKRLPRSTIEKRERRSELRQRRLGESAAPTMPAQRIDGRGLGRECG